MEQKQKDSILRGMEMKFQHDHWDQSHLCTTTIDINDINQYIDIGNDLETGTRLFSCLVCNNYSTNRKDQVKRHLSTVHTNRENLPCSNCGKNYKNRAVLVKHMNRCLLVHKSN